MLKPNHVLQDYCTLLASIKARTDAMVVMANHPDLIPDEYLAEFFQLQMRMICETLAIACLLVHGNIEGTRSGRLASAYQADLIMNALERLHPRFYPRPTDQVLKDGKVVEIKDVTEGFLTKQELLRSYRAAGNFLHMGDINDFLSKKQKSLSGAEVADWISKLCRLLNHHSIYLADEPNAWDGKEPIKFDTGEPAPKRQIVAQMMVAPDDKPAAWIYDTIGQAPAVWPPQ